MDKIEQVRHMIYNDELSTADRMCCFDIIGKKYLDGEKIYINEEYGFEKLSEDFNISFQDIIGLMLNSNFYSNKDGYIVFDGKKLFSCSDIDYAECMVLKYMDNECADEVINGTFGLGD